MTALETLLPAGTPVPARSTPRFDVFVSYARRDADFAVALVEMLRRGGFEVWFDEERISGGQLVQAEIVTALRASGAILCLVSRHWLESENCAWEAQVFWEEFAKKRLVIPVLQVPRRSADLPPYFISRNGIDWPHATPSNTLFWRLHCALLRKDPGPASQWAERGRQQLLGPMSARPGARPEEETRRRSRLGFARAALLCNRTRQWHAINIHASLERHEALLVQGARVEAPDLFLEAMELCFPESPARKVVPVPWAGPLPRTRGQFRDELAAALDCEEPDLERALRDWLSDCNLVLVHKPVLQADLEEAPLQDYYRGLLPRLLPAAGETRGFAKIVQGVAWTPSYAGWPAWFARRLWRRRAAWIERALERSRAKEVLKHLENLSDPLPLIVLPPLKRITRSDVKTWSRSLRPGQDPAAAVRDVLRGARTSADILARAAAYADSQQEPA